MLKSFQLKAARSVTGIEVREIALYLGISRTMVSRWEKQPKFSEIKTKKSSPESLIFFFKQHNIIFPNDNTIHLRTNNKDIISNHLTRFQLRASRAILDLTQEGLAQVTGITRSDVNYLETQQNITLLSNTKKQINDLILKEYFKMHGLSFPNVFTICYNK